MPLFEIKQSPTKATDSAIIKKSKTKATVTRRSGGNIVDRVKTIVAKVETALGKYADETLIIQDEQTLSDYIDACLTEGICAIDTETTGLDPMKDLLVGVGIYTHGQKTAYIPINHISYVTRQKVKGQLDAELVGKYLAKLQDCCDRPFVDIDMFNAVFDERVLIHGTGTRLKCTWDTYLASRCLNENEPSKALKPLHRKYILHGEEDAFKFDDLFTPELFRMTPIKTAALYAAHDPKITLEYGDYQREIFRTRENLKDIYWIFENIEMPCVDAVVDLEEAGVAFDMEYNAELKKKYHAILDEKEANFHKQCDMYADEIANYSGDVRLDNPINIQSVKQLQTLLYDIVKVKPVIDKKTKKPSRGTSEEILTKLKHPIADAILEYRSFSTLVSTFIDKLPECVNPKDGRIHCKFNQYGADTGRFSSQDPNLQNLPSHAKDIRPMFVATHYDKQVDFDTNEFLEVDKFTELQTDDGWVKTSTLSIGDKLSIDGDIFIISDIEIGDSTVKIFL